MNYDFVNFGEFATNRYTANNDVVNMDYPTLVRMLMEQISPQKRKEILDRLTEMNELQLDSFRGQPEPSRIGMLSSRKKDLSENPHPSMDQYNYKGENPVPFGLPSNSKGQNSVPFGKRQQPELGLALASNTNFDYKANFSQPANFTDFESEEINIDQILNDVHRGSPQAPVSDSLDKKLSMIKQLQNKIIMDKRKRKKKENTGY